MRALVAMRILVTRQGDGTYVSSLEPHLLLDGLTFASDVSQGPAAVQLLQVRRLLEPQATSLAAAKVTDEDLAVLREILDQCAEAETAEQFIELDMAFHRHIVGLVGNPVLATLLEIVSTRTQRVRLIRGIDTAAAFSSAHREHEAILAALTTGTRRWPQPPRWPMSRPWSSGRPAAGSPAAPRLSGWPAGRARRPDGSVARHDRAGAPEAYFWPDSCPIFARPAGSTPHEPS